MTKKSLLEAAADIFKANIADKDAKGEKFGAGKHPETYAPQPAGDQEASTATGHGDFVGGPVVDPAKNGGKAYVAKAPTASYPGTQPPVGSAPRPDIHKGTSPSGSTRAKAHDDGTVTEDFETDTTKKTPETMKPEGNGGTADPKSDIDTAKPISARIADYFTAKQGIRGQVSEDIAKIFDGQDLSEEFKNRAAMVFEAAVISVAKTVCEGVAAEYDAQLEAVTEAQKAEMSEKLDEYMDYFTTQWLAENKIAVETNLRQSIAEDFMSALHKVFCEHYIDVPADKINVVEQLADEVAELTGKLDEEIQKNVTLQKKLTEGVKADVIRKATEGLTESQVSKVKTLAESVEFKSEAEFAAAVDTLKTTLVETKTPVKRAGIDALNEDTAGDRGDKEPKVVVESTGSVSVMDKYVAALSPRT